jgi:hypothetical protein
LAAVLKTQAQSREFRAHGRETKFFQFGREACLGDKAALARKNRLFSRFENGLQK